MAVELAGALVVGIGGSVAAGEGFRIPGSTDDADQVEVAPDRPPVAVLEQHVSFDVFREDESPASPDDGLGAGTERTASAPRGVAAARVPGEATSSPSTGTLPRTGGLLIVLALLAAVLVVVGVLLQRRRKILLPSSGSGVVHTNR